ncbi:hypothetical protein BJV74DRAFT_535883 [Russula compacta]|nr:hypothetical protein BJV74DRAFT_535883 [Russula compacta]
MYLFPCDHGHNSPDPSSLGRDSGGNLEPDGNGAEMLYRLSNESAGGALCHLRWRRTENFFFLCTTYPLNIVGGGLLPGVGKATSHVCTCVLVVVWPVQDVNGNKERRKYEKTYTVVMVDLELSTVRDLMAELDGLGLVMSEKTTEKVGEVKSAQPVF